MSKKTGDRLFKLNVNHEAVAACQATIAGVYAEVGQILTEEREEKDMRKADMELQKLENMTDHKDEIYSRPKREWFLSEKQKREIQEKAREQHGERVEPVEKTKRISKFNRGKPQQRGRPQQGGRPQGRS